MDAQGERIRSMDALRRRVPSIVQRINADEALAMRAAANPLLALEELGYELDDDLKREVALRVRFDQRTIETLHGLSSRIHELAGESFEIDSPAQLGAVLFKRLELPALPPAPQRVVVVEGTIAARSIDQRARTAADPLEIPRKVPGGVRPPDPLEALRGAHPVVGPLLEYRRLQGSVPALASRELYERIKRGEVNAPRLRLRAVLRRGVTPQQPK